MSSFSNRDSTSNPAQSSVPHKQVDSFKKYEPPRQDSGRGPSTPPGPSQHPNDVNSGESPRSRAQRERAPSRPMSMVQAYQPPMMDVSQDTLPELQPIFTFLNSHSNKLYQEGYFLKLDDQNTRKYQLVLEGPYSNSLSRGKSQRRPNMDGMLCTACRDSLIIVGRRRIGCSWSRWGGSAQIHQPDRRLHQNGKVLITFYICHTANIF
jgi:hypothetical protein